MEDFKFNFGQRRIKKGVLPSIFNFQERKRRRKSKSKKLKNSSKGRSTSSMKKAVADVERKGEVGDVIAQVKHSEAEPVPIKNELEALNSTQAASPLPILTIKDEEITLTESKIEPQFVQEASLLLSTSPLACSEASFSKKEGENVIATELALDPLLIPASKKVEVCASPLSSTESFFCTKQVAIGIQPILDPLLVQELLPPEKKSKVCTSPLPPTETSSSQEEVSDASAIEPSLEELLSTNKCFEVCSSGIAINPKSSTGVAAHIKLQVEDKLTTKPLMVRELVLLHDEELLPTKKRRVPAYMGDFLPEDLEDPLKCRLLWEIANRTINRNKKQITNLENKVQHLTQKVISLNKIIVELKENKITKGRIRVSKVI